MYVEYIQSLIYKFWGGGVNDCDKKKRPYGFYKLLIILFKNVYFIIYIYI